jgi:hypothetical protein
MRFRHLRRRLRIRAPRVVVRKALPWPLQWLILAVVLGFCGAVGLWAFEFGRSIAGMDAQSRAELEKLRVQISELQKTYSEQLSASMVSEGLLKTEKATVDALTAQVRQLEATNQRLREDLGFFERLMPAGEVQGLAIRGIQVDKVSDLQWRWQLLVMQATRNARTFKGRVELVFTGLNNGKPWSLTYPKGGQPLEFVQYRRLEGLIDVPNTVVVKTVTARLIEGQTVRLTRTINVN